MMNVQKEMDRKESTVENEKSMCGKQNIANSGLSFLVFSMSFVVFLVFYVSSWFLRSSFHPLVYVCEPVLILTIQFSSTFVSLDSFVASPPVPELVFAGNRPANSDLFA